MAQRLHYYLCMKKTLQSLCVTCALLSGASSASAALMFSYDAGAQTLSITGSGQGTATVNGFFRTIGEWYEGSTINTEQAGTGDLGAIDVTAGLNALPTTNASVNLRFYRDEAAPTTSPVEGFQFFYISPGGADSFTLTGNGTAISVAGADPLVLAALQDAQTPGGLFGSEFNVVDSDSGIGSDIDGGFAQVPEPSTSLLSVLAAGLILRRRR